MYGPAEGLRIEAVEFMDQLRVLRIEAFEFLDQLRLLTPCSTAGKRCPHHGGGFTRPRATRL